MSGYYNQPQQPTEWQQLPLLQQQQPPQHPQRPQPPSADQAPAAQAFSSDGLVAIAKDFAQSLHEHPIQRFRVYRKKKSGFRAGPATPLSLMIEWKPDNDASKTSPIISVTAENDSSRYETFQQLCIAAAESLDPRNCSGYICRWNWLDWANRDIDGIRVKFQVDSFPHNVYPLIRVLDDGSEYKLHKSGHKGGKPSKGPGGAVLPKSPTPPRSSQPSTSQAQYTPVSSEPEQPSSFFYRSAFANATTDPTPHVDHRRSQSRQSRHQSKSSHRHRHSQDLSEPPLPYAPTPSGRLRPDFSTQDAVAEYRALAASGELASSSTAATSQAQSTDAMDFTYTEPTQTPATTEESTHSTQTQPLMPPPPRPSSRRSGHAGSEKPRSGKGEKSHSKRGKKK